MVRLRFRGTYRRYFIIYVSFFILLSAILFPLTNISVRTLEEQTLQAAQEVLVTGLKKLEAELENVYRIGMALYSDPNYYLLASIPKGVLTPDASLVKPINNFQKEYRNFALLLNLADDFGMVFPNSLVVTSSRVHMPGETFYGVYFRADGYDTMQEWTNAIQNRAKGHAFAAMTVSRVRETYIGMDAPTDSVIFALPLPLKGNWNTFCYAIFSEKNLVSTLALQEMLENGALTLTESDGNVLIDQSAENIADSVSIEARSDNYSFVARMSISRRYFLDQMANFTRLISIVLVGYVLVGVALVILYSRRNAKPMMRMMNAASQVSLAPDAENGSRQDAYAYMEGFIRQVDSRLRENRLALASQEILIKENLMERLLRRQIDFSHSREMVRSYFPDFPLPCQMALIRPDDTAWINALAPEAFSDLQVRMRDAVTRCALPGALLHFTAGSLVVMQRQNDRLPEIYDQIVRVFQNDLGVSVRVGISLPFDQMEEIDQVFLRLRHILRFSDAEERVLMEDDTARRAPYLGVQYSTRFYETLSRGRLEPALEALDAELAAFRQSGDSDENVVQQLFYAYRLILCQVMQFGNISKEDISLPAYDAAATMDQLFDGIRQSARTICQAMKRPDADRKQEADLLAAVEAEISNPDLSIELMMNRFSLSEKNVQRLMRGATGMTFYEYLNHRRMEKARQALEETDTPIQEISRACGYASVNTFYKAFQRAWSMAPNAMRKKALHNAPRK